MFDKKINADDLRDLVAVCETVEESSQAQALEKVFGSLYWKFARSVASGTQQNPKWVLFSRLMALEAFTEAAKMLIPEGHNLYVCGFEGRDVTCYLSTSTYKTVQEFGIKDHRGHAKTIALAIGAAVARAHIALTEMAIIKSKLSLATE